ncbi:hypothetical protein SASPL_111408 [Salvia splendens]|uniref:Glycosyltransferase N-terminal domain-containing protein n=1 Tax=Salvia splendens TaxID=180675 RepID=A0A8X9A3L5_SALSN|nr:putative UDP-rhamnose:rhamnosyltransferase 1 [Salvia splendens]KAG6427168.1 hypothetical protein SASPL_111408 [Salvia splendens]
MDKVGRKMNGEKEVHVVMVPWLAFGHMIPFLDLSIALAKFGIHVSFISTSRNISRLPKIPPNLSPFIDFIPLPLPKLDSSPLPDNAEATTDIPADRMDDLKKSCDLFQESISNFIANKLPNWIFVDFFFHKVLDTAQELDIPVIFNLIFTASSSVFCWTPEFVAGDGKGQRRLPQDMTVPPDWVDFPSQVVFRKHEAPAMHNILYGARPSGITDGERMIQIAQRCQAFAIRTCLELESDYLDIYSKITGKPVIPLGCLPPEKVVGTKIIWEEPWSRVFDWLDKQKPNEVVFVGFGSEYKLKREEIHEISYGIELSGLPFFFLLAKPDWGGGGGDDEVLPPGFESRTAGRGFVQIGWAPQREILAHPSIGASLFHAGWSSVVENLTHANCLVLLPFIITQPLDTGLLVEKGLAIEVERAEDGSFTRNDIANALQVAMVTTEGEALRARTKEAANGIFANKELNHSYINNFVEYLKEGVYEKK